MSRICQGRLQPGAGSWALRSRLHYTFAFFPAPALEQKLYFSVRAYASPACPQPSLLLWRASAPSHSLTFLRQWSCLLRLCFVSFVTANEPGDPLKGQAPADRVLTSFVCTRVLCLRNHYLALDGVIFFSLSLPRYKFNYLVTATLIKKVFSLEVSF